MSQVTVMKLPLMKVDFLMCLPAKCCKESHKIIKVKPILGNGHSEGIQNINPAGGINTDQLVWEHTPYPYVYISLKENRALDVYQMICGNAPMRSGIDSQVGIAR